MSTEHFQWGEGRGVLRRPEAKGSVFEDSYVIHSRAEAEALSGAVVASVTRRSRLGDDELARRRERLFELEAK